MLFNATFNNISALFVEKTRVSRFIIANKIIN
jgi:hypothetical protein